MQVKFSKTFKKQFDKSGVKVQAAFENRLRLFMSRPDHPLLRHHRLVGKLSLYYSINVTGDWRAIYSIQEVGEQRVYLFEMLGTHSQLYR